MPTGSEHGSGADGRPHAPTSECAEQSLLGRFRGLYGGHPAHLLAMLASFALLGYVITVMGPSKLWNPSVWWQSILVWFLGAAALHDLVLFPLYALADRTHTGVLRAVRGRGKDHHPRVPAANYVRIPVLASGLLLLLFFPGIIEQGSAAYLRATGQTQAPFLHRWLLAVAVVFGASALLYAARWGIAYRRGRAPAAPRPSHPAATHGAGTPR